MYNGLWIQSSRIDSTWWNYCFSVLECSAATVFPLRVSLEVISEHERMTSRLDEKELGRDVSLVPRLVPFPSGLKCHASKPLPHFERTTVYRCLFAFALTITISNSNAGAAYERSLRVT